MKIIGLTGSIAMGKSTTAKIFRSLGIPVHDSDQVVHDFYNDEAAILISVEFPDAVINGKVDRKKLSESITKNPKRLKALEQIVHPFVEKKRSEFLAFHTARGTHLVLLDIPLLFEIGGQETVDIVAVVSASEQIQKKRALSRPSMTLEKFNVILSKQIVDSKKRKDAHVTINTSISIEETKLQVRAFIRAIN